MKILTLIFALVAILNTAAGQSHAIRVEKSGDGTPVLYLPGFTTPGSVWRETVTHLEGNFQHHLVSYAGFNGIPAIEAPWYESLKRELLSYILKEDLQRLRIIGHSMGGNLAIDIAAEVPGRVDKLILVDAIPCMRELMMPGVSADQVTYDNPYNNSILNQSAEEFRRNARMMAHSMTLDKVKADSILKWSEQADRKTYVYGFTDLLKLDLRGVLHKVDAETLILGAPFPEKAIVASNFEAQYVNLRHKILEIADEGRHFIMFDQPDWFYQKVNNFLLK